MSEAIAKVLKQRPEIKKTVLVHMSEVGNLVDGSRADGAHNANAEIWNVSRFDSLAV